MIAHYRWTTITLIKAKGVFAGCEYKKKRTFWRGWFLFGFFPLYITAIDVDYE